MFHPKIAEELRARGHDVNAVVVRVDLAGMADDRLLRIATDEDRVLVTENVRDFEILRARAVAAAQPCSGLIYTNRQHFPRERQSIGKIVDALDRLMSSGRLPGAGETDWLA